MEDRLTTVFFLALVPDDLEAFLAVFAEGVLATEEAAPRRATRAFFDLDPAVLRDGLLFRAFSVEFFRLTTPLYSPAAWCADRLASANPRLSPYETKRKETSTVALVYRPAPPMSRLPSTLLSKGKSIETRAE